MRYLCAIIATTLLAGSAIADTINVPGDQPTIQLAIDTASNGDVIVVAPGTYYENITRFSAPAITLVSSGSSADTIIDGQGGRGIYISWQSYTSGNSFSIDGFTFRNCDATNIGPGYKSGAAFFLNYSGNAAGHVEITDCVFTQNSSSAGDWDGGVIASRDGSLLISNCTFDSNSATCVVFCGNFNGEHSQQARDCTFSQNTGHTITKYSYGEIVDCTFTGNTVTNAVVYEPYLVSGCVFTSNTSQYGSAWLFGDSFVENSIFQSNHSTDDGGAIRTGDSSGTSVTNCTFIENTTDENGGAIALYGASHIHNCTFNSNTATYLGGAIYLGNDDFDVLVSNNTGCENSLPTYYGDLEIVNDSVTELCVLSGHCCIGGGCITSDEIECGNADGYFTTSNCSDCPEPEPDLGACCISGSCVPTTLEGCYTAGGTYAGDGVSCSETACQTYCDGDTNQDGSVDIFDLLKVIDGWGSTCP